MKLFPDQNTSSMVIAYYRHSSSSQNEASINQQREMVHKWAQAEGLQMVQEYYDAAMTGTDTDRPDLQRMLHELPKIKPAYVAAWKNDRLSRDRLDILNIKHTIQLAGACLHYRGHLP